MSGTKLVQVKFNLSAQAVIQIVLDEESYQVFTEEELVNLAIVKIKNMQGEVKWTCDEVKAIDFKNAQE